MRDCGVQIAPLTEHVALYFEEGTEPQRLDILREQPRAPLSPAR